MKRGREGAAEIFGRSNQARNQKSSRDNSHSGDGHDQRALGCLCHLEIRDLEVAPARKCSAFSSRFFLYGIAAKLNASETNSRFDDMYRQKEMWVRLPHSS